MTISRLLGASALAGTLLLVTPAFAQTTDGNASQTPAAEPEQETAQEVLVTGSRISRPNDESAAPITSVRAEEILSTGSVSLGDALNDLPSLRSTYSQSNSGRFIGTGGLNLLDLRGLGTTRTLTLVNGRRHVTTSPGSFEVDTNTIPSDLLERVDVITGGNSAVYGSDAVAGVVNFVLKQNFEGLTVKGQGSVTSRGDRGQYFVSATGGKNFADGRGNIAVSLEYSKANEVLLTDRADMTGAYIGTIGLFQTDNTLGEPASGDGIPDNTFLRGVRSVQYGDGGGLIVGCPTAAAAGETAAAFANRRAIVCNGLTDPSGGQLAYGFFFAPDGTLVRNDASQGVGFDLRTTGGGASVVGGLGSTFLNTGQIYPELDRYSANLLSHFDFSDAFKLRLEAKYVRVDAKQESSPVFQGGTLSPTMSRTNAFLTPQATALLNQILTPTATTITVARNNVDFGARAEFHKRETWRAVLTASGDLTDHLRYEVAGNYGRFESYYKTGGNVLLANYNRAYNAVLAPAGYTGSNFVLNSQGQRVVCAVNANASTTDDDAACVPLNLFGSGQPSQAALNYVLVESFRNEKAEQINATAYIGGDTGGFFELPGGAIDFALGAEYRRETASSIYDPIISQPTRLTFLNSIAPFTPPALELKEAFGEINVPILKSRPFFQELTLQAAGRVSDYNVGPEKPVFAWNVGGVYAPVEDFRVRVSYAKSVRSPTLSDLFATNIQTFAGIADPCSQTNINNGPNRVANCRAAGVPTTFTLPGGQTVPFINTATSTPAGAIRGNPTLQEETSKSFTAGFVAKPREIPGLTVSADYYAISIDNQIASLGGQTVVNLCYDSPSGIDNQYCAAVFRRPDGTFAGQSGISIGGTIVSYTDSAPSFFQQPFNYARQATRGVDISINYERRFGGIKATANTVVTYVISRRSYTDVLQPGFATQLDGTLGDPTWSSSSFVNLDFGLVDIGYNFRYIDKMTLGAYNTQLAVQGRPPTNADAFPIIRYPVITYSDIRIGVEPNDRFRLYMGVDNLFDQMAPGISGLYGTGAGGAIYSPLGRSFYAGATAKF